MCCAVSSLAAQSWDWHAVSGFWECSVQFRKFSRLHGPYTWNETTTTWLLGEFICKWSNKLLEKAHEGSHCTIVNWLLNTCAETHLSCEVGVIYNGYISYLLKCFQPHFVLFSVLSYWLFIMYCSFWIVQALLLLPPMFQECNLWLVVLTRCHSLSTFHGKHCPMVTAPTLLYPLEQGTQVA